MNKTDLFKDDYNDVALLFKRLNLLITFLSLSVPPPISLFPFTPFHIFPRQVHAGAQPSSSVCLRERGHSAGWCWPRPRRGDWQIEGTVTWAARSEADETYGGVRHPARAQLHSGGETDRQTYRQTVIQTDRDFKEIPLKLGVQRE